MNWFLSIIINYLKLYNGVQIIDIKKGFFYYWSYNCI